MLVRQFVPALAGLCLIVAAGDTLAKPKPKPHAAGPHHTKLMPYVEVPVERGAWGPVNVACRDLNDTNIQWFDPKPPTESKWLDCAPGMKQIGPNTYQPILCPAPNAEAPSTYVVQSRTRMTIDGDLYKFCPMDQINPVYRP